MSMNNCKEPNLDSCIYTDFKSILVVGGGFSNVVLNIKIPII